MAAQAGLGLPAYITTLLFSDLTSFMSIIGLCLFAASQQEYLLCSHFLHLHFFLYSSPHNNTELSCDLYLHKESGPGKRSPCPGCVWLSRVLSPLTLDTHPQATYVLLVSLFLTLFSFFWSLFPFSHFIVYYLHFHHHVWANTHPYAFCLFRSPALCLFVCTISTALRCTISSDISAFFCKKYNVAQKLVRPIV